MEQIDKKAVLELLDKYKLKTTTGPILLKEDINRLPVYFAQSNKWTDIDVESENLPADYQECWLLTKKNKVYRGWLIKYGDDLANAYWYLPDNLTHINFDDITAYIIFNQPEPPKK